MQWLLDRLDGRTASYIYRQFRSPEADPPSIYTVFSKMWYILLVNITSQPYKLDFLSIFSDRY